MSGEDQPEIQWQFNYPWREIPREFIEGIKYRLFSYDDFLKAIPDMEASLFWNLVCLFNKQVFFIMWGRVDPLERELYISRMCVHPEIREAGITYKVAWGALREICDKLDCNVVRWASHQAEAYLRIMKDEGVKLLPMRVLEWRP